MTEALAALSSVIQLFGMIIFEYYGWVVIVAIFAYLIWRNNRQAQEWIDETEHMLLLIQVPKTNDKKELSAEQMFASLHGILRSKSDLIKEGVLQEHISFEMASVENKIQFYVWVPVHLKDFVEGQIYAQYPSVQIDEHPVDYTGTELGDRAFAGTELALQKNDVLPIKTFQSFEVDPLAGITAVLAKLDEAGEEMWVQILARPIDDSWQEKSFKYIETVKAGGTPSPFSNQVSRALIELPVYVIGNFLRGILEPPTAAKEEKKAEAKLSTGQQAVVKAVEEKATKLGYSVKVRVAYLGPDQELAKQRIQAIIGAFKQYNTTNLNGYASTRISDDTDILDDYRSRTFMDHGDTLNIEELASLYHLPHTNVETPNMSWNTAKTGEPPSDLPTEKNTDDRDISYFGLTTYRGAEHKFGFTRFDRSRHLYIIGQTGAGKSGTLNLLTLSDIYHNEGFAIVDPHGDYATDMLKYIPEHRLKDVIYFNPADVNNPISFNPLEVTDPMFKNNISSEVIGVMKRMFDSWGPRLEYILRYTILALLDYPDSTMLGITRMLTEKSFRNKVIKEIKDPVVKNFWVNEFASWNDKFANEAVAPILNKVGAFVANPLIRNIIGQPKSSFDMREVMDDGKILIVNLSRGLMGEDNAAILGALMVTKIQLAAMSRADMDLDKRRPFYLYVDEFQNFATDSFAVILSEARKYSLILTVANQYTSQMPDTVRDAVFGNVGSMISFRVGAEDANAIGKYFAPAFEPEDLIKLDNRHFYISMVIGGNKRPSFSGRTLQLPPPENDLTDKIIELTRANYTKPRVEVEAAIERWTSGQDDHVQAAKTQSGLKAAAEGGEATPKAPSGSVSLRSDAKPETEHKPKGILGDLKNPEPPAPKPARSGSGRNGERRKDDRNDRGGRGRGGSGSGGGKRGGGSGGSGGSRGGKSQMPPSGESKAAPEPQKVNMRELMEKARKEASERAQTPAATESRKDDSNMNPGQEVKLREA